MRSVSSNIGTLTILNRLPSSRHGNPRFLLYIAGFHCVTAPDSPLGYSVMNMDGKEVRATIGVYYGRATLNTVELA